MERIDRYEIESILGTGAFATVWLARDPVLDLRVAIKVLADNWSRDPGIRARFIEEARVLWQADSPRIVRVHHVGELDDGRPYFVMGWADRGNLRERMNARFEAGTAFSVAETASIAAELCRALRDVHALGRIHRDIKPANVLIRSAMSRQARRIGGLADDEALVIADFGLARQIEASTATMVSGSPAYVAPEQALGHERLDERADIYPLGLILVELATGRSPATRATMLDAATTQRLDLAAHLAQAGVAMPPAMARLAALMIEPDPANRPQSAGDLATELAGFAETASQAPAAATVVETGSITPLASNPSHPPPQAWPAPQPGTDQAVSNPPISNPPTSNPPVAGTPISNPPVAGTPVAGTPISNPPISNPPVAGTPPGVSPTDPIGTTPGFQPPGAGSERTGSEGGGRSRVPLLAALGAVAALVIVGIIAATQLGGSTGGSDPVAGSSTTSSSATTQTTLAPSTTAPIGDIEFVSVPFPEFHRLEAGSDETRQVANVASSVEDVAAFYETVQDPTWQVDEITPVGDDIEISLTAPGRTATIELTKAAVTAGDGITRIEVRYSSG